MKRTFIAVSIPLLPSVAALLTNLKIKLKNDNIKWVEIHNMHITLFFLGDTDSNKISEISTFLVETFSNFSTFEVELRGIGMFSKQGNPQVIWIGMKNYDQLVVLKKSIDIQLVEMGFNADNRPFKPHLTLGRIKYASNKNLLKNLVKDYENTQLGTIKINEIIFYESELTRSGPIYTPIKKIMLV